MTQLSPEEERQCLAEAEDGKLGPHVDLSPTAAYDVRGFWKALQAGDPRAQTAVDPHSGDVLVPDLWRTPYHHTFSVDSLYARETAPRWNAQGQLVDPRTGEIVCDERAQALVQEGLRYAGR
jgi:hypothetical protein